MTAGHAPLPGHQVFGPLTACTFTPATPYFRATRSLDVPRNGSKRSAIATVRKPMCVSTETSSASGRAPAIQPVHRSISRLIVSESSLATTMSP
jgi:hypothetical protein